MVCTRGNGEALRAPYSKGQKQTLQGWYAQALRPAMPQIDLAAGSQDALLNSDNMTSKL